MKGFVKDIDWINAEAMKYWSFTAGTPRAKQQEIVHNAIFGQDYIGALKVDGYYQRLVKDDDGNCFMIARSKNVNGEAVNKYEWVPQLHDFMAQLPNGTVLLCECYLPGKEGSRNITTLLGCGKEKCIDRQNKGQKLHFYIFDICAFMGSNLINKGISERVEVLNNLARLYPHDYVEWATYYEGEELWNKLADYLQSGREGIVLVRKDCPIYFKRTPARMSIKVKKEIRNTIDCFFTGKYMPATKDYTGKELESWPYWINEMTGQQFRGLLYKDYIAGKPIKPVTKGYFFGWAGSLQIGVLDADGRTVELGWLSNLTEDIKATPRDYQGAPIEVTAMEINWDNGTPTLRHAKMVQFRPDLSLADCTLEKIKG